MSRPVQIALVVLGLLLFPPALLAQSAPAPGGPLLGRAHVWVKYARADFGGTATTEWGLDQEAYLGIEVYGSEVGDSHFGGELGRASVGSAINEDGEEIRDLDFYSLELNWKQAFDLRHGLSADVGLGGSMIYVDGQEVEFFAADEATSPLADLGFGVQVFADFNWRVRRLLVGVDIKYQYAWDILSLDYSNLRLGGHIGLVF